MKKPIASFSLDEDEQVSQRRLDQAYERYMLRVRQHNAELARQRELERALESAEYRII